MSNTQTGVTNNTPTSQSVGNIVPDVAGKVLKTTKKSFKKPSKVKDYKKEKKASLQVAIESDLNKLSILQTDTNFDRKAIASLKKQDVLSKADLKLPKDLKVKQKSSEKKEKSNTESQFKDVSLGGFFLFLGKMAEKESIKGANFMKCGKSSYLAFLNDDKHTVTKSRVKPSVEVKILSYEKKDAS